MLWAVAASKALDWEDSEVQGDRGMMEQVRATTVIPTSSEQLHQMKL
jgi:hypothetical protein